MSLVGYLAVHGGALIDDCTISAKCLKKLSNTLSLGLDRFHLNTCSLFDLFVLRSIYTFIFVIPTHVTYITHIIDITSAIIVFLYVAVLNVIDLCGIVIFMDLIFFL